jgi:hypothetical protein
VTNPRQRLVAATARLEALRKRNEEQATRLRQGAVQMADHATGALKGLRGRILRGDPEAARHGRKAAFGRYIARLLGAGGEG